MYKNIFINSGYDYSLLSGCSMIQATQNFTTWRLSDSTWVKDDFRLGFIKWISIKNSAYKKGYIMKKSLSSALEKY